MAQNNVPLSNKAKFWVFHWYLWITFGMFVVAICSTVFLHGKLTAYNIPLLTVLGIPFVFLFFVQKQKIQEAELLSDLFKRFTDRYDSLKSELHRIGRKSFQELARQERNTIESYIDLCAEEYLFMKLGHIPAEVWRSWENGMEVHFRQEHLVAAWEENNNAESCYGFKPPTGTRVTVLHNKAA